MVIGVDKAQQDGKHILKHKMLQDMGHQLIDLPIPVGDYIEITPEIKEVIDRRGDKLKKMDLIGLINVSVDTKRDCEELYSCLMQGHKRFSDSCFLAHNNGIRLVILVENLDGVTSVDNLEKWKNEKRWKSYFIARKRAERAGTKNPKPPCKPSQLKQIMWTMHEKYGTEFVFCRPDETAQKIVEYLTSDNSK